MNSINDKQAHLGKRLHGDAIMAKREMEALGGLIRI